MQRPRTLYWQNIPSIGPLYFTQNARLPAHYPSLILHAVNMKNLPNNVAGELPENLTSIAAGIGRLSASVNTWKEWSMKTGRDYSCEIMGVIVLAILSALSHFWYILIAIGILTGLAGVGLLVAIILIRIGRQLLARVLNPAPQEALPEAAVPRDVGPNSRPSLPVA